MRIHKENDLRKDSILSLIFKLALPAMLAQFVNVLYSIVDRIYISHLPEIGDLAIAGVGVCAPIISLVTSISYLVGLGGAPLLAMRLGENKPEEANNILNNSFLMLCVMSVIITPILLILKKPMLMTFGASADTFVYANGYFTIYALGSIFAILSVGLNNFITCQGFSKVSMMSVLVGAVINIALDPLFIFTFKMGVKGAAIATVIAQAVSCLWVVLFLFGKRTTVKIKFKNYNIKTMLKIVKIGVSPFLIIATDSVILIVFNFILQKYGGAEMGDIYITAGTILISYMQIYTMPMGGITIGCGPILSYNYGARDTARVKKAFFGVLLLCIGFALIMLLISFVAPQYFVKIFTSNQQIADITIWGIKVYSIGFIFLAAQYACVDSMTALGQAGIAITMSLSRKMLVMLVAIIVLPIFFGVKGAFYAEPIADVLLGITSSVTCTIVLNKLLKKRKEGLVEI